MLTAEEIAKIDALEDTHWWYRGMREASRDLIRQHLPQGPLRILDIGCGTGGNMRALAAFGDVAGLDVDARCIDASRRKGLIADFGNLMDLRLPAETYDLVTMFDVLNQAAPSAMPDILGRIRASLVPGGLVAFREPASRAAAGRHDLAVGIKKRFDRRFTRELLGGAGFEPRQIVYLNSFLFVPIVLRRRLQLATGRHAESDLAPTPPPLNAMLLSLLRIEHRVRRFIPLPCGTSLLAVGQRV